MTKRTTAAASRAAGYGTDRVGRALAELDAAMAELQDEHDAAKTDDERTTIQIALLTADEAMGSIRWAEEDNEDNEDNEDDEDNE